MLRELGFVRRDKWGNARWTYECFCGKVFVAKRTEIRSGHTKSCGCLVKSNCSQVGKLNTKHGQARDGCMTKEYKTWTSMNERCYRKNWRDYKHWGGRGITVCGPWRESFENFLKDMGSKPTGMSLDRIDNDGNYTPLNCRWATSSEQNSNKRRRT
jgi:hypothetical protein